MIPKRTAPAARWFTLPLVLFLASCFGDIKVFEHIARSGAFSPTGTVELVAVSGDVTIIGWDKNEVSVEAVKGARSQERLDAIQVRIEIKDDVLLVKTEYPPSTNSRDTGKVECTIHVPRTASLRNIETVNSKVKILDVSGSMKVRNVNGNIDVSRVAADATLESVNGFITAALDKLTAGRKVHVKTVNGGIDLSAPADLSAKIDASLVVGWIHQDFGDALPESKHGQLHGTLGTGDAQISAEAVNGKISLKRRPAS